MIVSYIVYIASYFRSVYVLLLFLFLIGIIFQIQIVATECTHLLNHRDTNQATPCQLIKSFF